MIRTVVRLLLVCSIALAPATARAQQEATLSGAVIDSSGGVMPGVTITALHESSGNTFLGVTDERGEFRLPVRAGRYQLTLELSGFAPLVRRVELLVGQTAASEARDGAVRCSGSRSRSPAKRRSLTPPRPRSAATSTRDRCRSCRSTAATGWIWQSWRRAAGRTRRATFRRSRQGYSQINIDGQQITHLIPGTDQNQPSYGMDAIAEFVLVTNRFDATQGRSAGMLANAITKSGTNTFCRHAVGLLPAAIASTPPISSSSACVPYSNQQVSGTFGGPIVARPRSLLRELRSRA